MTRPTDTPVPSFSRMAGGLRLRGMTWLIWRQHRAVFWTLIAATALGVGWIAFQRAQMMEYLDRYGWPHPQTDAWTQGFPAYYSRLSQTGYAIVFVPIVFGVFVGAPLLASDLENGTAKLVVSQSVSHLRWLAAKLCISLGMGVVSTVIISLAFSWWWQPVGSKTTLITWADIQVFDSTGPVPTALTLLTVAGGIAIGMLLRRALMAMVITVGFAVVVQIAWANLYLSLGNVTTLTTHNVTNTFPRLPPGVALVQPSLLTSSGGTVDWTTCGGEPNDKAHAACLAQDHIVGWSVKYLPFSQMSAMQWFGATVLLILTIAVLAFVLLRARDRLY